MKPIKDFEELYAVSENGIVISLRWGKILGQTYNGNSGYLKVRLQKNGKQYSKLVHRLVAETFIPNSLNLPQVNHLSGIKTANNVENLVWSTAKENVNHAYNTGLISNVGETAYSAKLSDSDIVKIRELSGIISQRKLEKIYGVSHGYISRIINNKKRKNYGK